MRTCVENQCRREQMRHCFFISADEMNECHSQKFLLLWSQLLRNFSAVIIFQLALLVFNCKKARKKKFHYFSKHKKSK